MFSTSSSCRFPKSGDEGSHDGVMSIRLVFSRVVSIPDRAPTFHPTPFVQSFSSKAFRPILLGYDWTKRIGGKALDEKALDEKMLDEK